MDWGNLLFGVQGRINRAKFWLAVLVYFVVSVVVGVIGFASGSETLAQTLSSLVSLVTFISGIFVGFQETTADEHLKSLSGALDASGLAFTERIR